MSRDSCCVTAELFTRHTYRPKGSESVANTLIVSWLSLVVEMILPFLTHEILLMVGKPSSALQLRVVFSFLRRVGLLD